jgi:hypothetical protein
MSKPVLADLDFMSVARITNLPDPVTAQHPATKAYVDSAVEGLAWKDSVRAASTANINLASPGATIDGIAMVLSDRFLAKDQTAGAENGLYVWNGAAVVATRSLDANTANELEQAIVTVEEGTSAAATFRQTVVNFILGTTPIAWTSFGNSVPAASTAVSGTVTLTVQGETDAKSATKIATPAQIAAASWMLRKALGDIGDGSATSITINHNLGTRDIQIELFRNSAPFDSPIFEVQRTTVNSVTVVFVVAPTAAQYRCVVIG